MNPRGLAASAGVLAVAALLAAGVTKEVPVGGLGGLVTMPADDRPLRDADVVLYPQFPVPDGARGTWSTKTDGEGRFRFGALPAGSYTASVFGKAHRASDVAVTVVEGERGEVTIETERSMPDLEVYGNERVYLPKDTPSITARGLSDAPHIEVSVRRVSNREIERRGDVAALLSDIVANRIPRDVPGAPWVEEVASVDQAIERRDVEGQFVEQVRLPAQDEGIYLCRVRAGKETRFSWFVVSRLALVTKAQGDRLLSFVTDLETGSPVVGAKLTLHGRGSPSNLGTTARDGTLEAPIPVGEGVAVVAAQSGASRAYSWFYRGTGRGEGSTMVWTQTDRPVYRPGDTVRFKAVVREPVPEGYRLPSVRQATVEVRDPDDEPVASFPIEVDEMGAASGEFRIDPTALPGPFSLAVRAGRSTGYLTIPVASYRRPEFRVVVTPEAPFYVRGEAARFRVKAEYFTGEPVAGASLTANVYRATRWTPYGPDEDEWLDGHSLDPVAYGDFVETVEARTDRLGEAVLYVRTAGGREPQSELSDMTYAVSASIADQAGRQFSGQGSVVVGRGDVDLVAQFADFVARPGATSTLSLEARDQRSGGPVEGAEVSVEYGRRRWSGGKSAFIPEGRTAVRTGPDGRANLDLRPAEPGEFVVRCATADSRGRTVASEASLWVYDRDTVFGGRTPTLQVVLDKRSYLPTDRALALVRTDRPGGSALVTVEADRVRWRKVVPLEGAVTEVALDVLADYAPNVTVSVAYVRGKTFAQAERTLRVDLAQRKIEVAVSPDRDVLEPGQTVAFTVTTRDLEGRPVAADVALGVVDEGVYSIAEDRADPLRDFYPRRWSAVATSYSFPEIYLDGEEKTPATVPLRTRFEETAHWAPSVRTGPDGTAQVTVRLPDNLTEWRATATAFTSDTRIGKARAKVVARRNLMARLSLPPFITVGDRQDVVGRVTNATDRPMRVRVRLTADGIPVTGETDRTLTVAARSAQDVRWTLEPNRTGTARLRLAAEGEGGPSDGLELALPIRLRGREVVAAESGDTERATEIVLERAPGAVGGDLTLTLAPTLVGRLVEELPALVEYPYGCIEQTLSRFVPALAVARLADRSGILVPGLAEKLPEVTKVGLARLRAAQRPEGGWGWWDYGEPSPAMTAYAVEGLVRAREVGVDVRPQMLARALDWAEKWLGQRLGVPIDPKAWDRYDAVELAYAVLLARASPVAVKTLDRHSELDGLPTRTLAFALMGRERQVALGLGGEAAREAARRELLSRADETAASALWPGDYGLEDSALALQALIAGDPAAPIVGKAVRGLAAARPRTRWVNTRATARLVYAVADTLATAGELRPDLTVTVTVPGQDPRTVRFQGQGALSATEELRVPLADLPEGPIRIRIEPVGTGRVYYSATLRQDVAEDSPAPQATAEWVSLRREYVASTPQRLEDGTVRIVGGRGAISAATSGQVFRVRLTLRAERPVTYLLLEDPIPSHCRIVGADTPSDGVTWLDWWSRSVYLDDRAAFFVESLAPGKDHVIEYPLRAEAVGVCAAMPAVLSKMYQPEVRASTGQTVLEVRGR